MTLRGTVTDDRGRPVAGAKVYALFPDAQPRGGAISGPRWREPLPSSTATDAGGGYTFPDVTVPRDAFSVHVAASAAGHAPAFASVRSAPDAPGDLRAGLVLSTQHAALTVRATTAGGEPAAGVWVRLRPSEGVPSIVARSEDRPLGQLTVLGFGLSANNMSALFMPRSVTGPDGAAHFADLLPGLWDVEAADAPEPGAVSAPPSARSARSLGVAVQAGQDAACALALSAALAAPTARVLSLEGKPVAVQGAFLEPGSTTTDSHVFADHDPNASDAPSDAPMTVPIDRPGLWRVTADYREDSESNTTYGSSVYGSYIPEPYIAAGALVALSPALPPPGLLVLRARRRVGGTLRIRLEGVDGKPAAGTVFAPSINGAPEYAATVDASGEAVFAAMPAGSYTLVGSLSSASTPPLLAMLYGDAPLPTDAALAGRTFVMSQTVTVALDAETRVVLRAVRAGFVRGRIVSAPGTPLSRYSLPARYVQGYGTADAAGRINPRTGEFVYGPLPPGPARIALECENGGRRRPASVGTIAANLVGGRVTSLAPVVAAALPLFRGLDLVRGTVLLHDGVTPAWGARTVLFTPSPFGTTYPAVIEQAPADALGRLTGVDIGPAGGYYGPYGVYAHVPAMSEGRDPDAPTLVAWMPGLTGAVLVPYAHGRDVRVVLPPPSHLSGRVTVGGRSALGQAGTIRVRAAYQGRGRLNALLSRDVTARPDGTFRLDGLTPGRYQVQAARDGIWLSAALLLIVGAAADDGPDLALDIALPGAPSSCTWPECRGGPSAWTARRVLWRTNFGRLLSPPMGRATCGWTAWKRDGIPCSRPQAARPSRSTCRPHIRPEPRHEDRHDPDATMKSPEEQTASEAEMLYQRLLDLSLEGLLRVDAADRITYANARMAEMVGWAPGDLEGRSVYDLLFPEDAARERRAARGRGEREQYEARLRRRDGEECWVIAGVSVLESGGAYAGTFSLMTDITERRRAELSLRRSERDLQFAIGAARLGTFYCEWPLDKIVWSKTCAEHFFLPPGAEVDFTLFYSLLHPDDRAPTRAAVERALAERAEYNVEYRTLAPDGRTRWVNAVGRVYYDAHGAPVRFDGVTMDITARKEVERELAASLEREKLVNRISRAIRAAQEPEAVLQTAVDALGASLDVDHCYFVTYDLARGKSVLGPEWHRPGRDSLAGEYNAFRYSYNQDADYLAGRTYAVEDALALPGGGAVSAGDPGRLRALVRAPLSSGPNMTSLGVAMAESPRLWTANEVMLVEAIASQAQAALESARLRQRELRIATALQEALQPAVPAHVPGLSLGAYTKPALDEAQVGGGLL